MNVSITGGTTRRAAAHAKERLLWGALLVQARRCGVDPRELGRVREYLQNSVGLRAAAFEHPAQRPEHYFPRPPGTPWHDPADHPWTASLSEAYAVVRSEFRRVRDRARRQPDHVTDRGAWSVYYLYFLGRRVVPNCRQCPETARVIDSLRGIRGVRHAYFSILAPDTHIKPHCGPINAWLRCHLGLEIPPGARMRVDSETRTMEEGECLIFDDAFEHEVWNPSTQPRAVLILDFWHPNLTDPETWAMGQIIRMSGTFFNLGQIFNRHSSDALRTTRPDRASRERR